MLENVKTTREQGLKNRIFLKDLLKHNNLEEFFEKDFNNLGQYD